MPKDKKPRNKKVKVINKNKNKNSINITINSNNKRKVTARGPRQNNQPSSIVVSNPGVPYMPQDNSLHHIVPLIQSLHEKVLNSNPQPVSQVVQENVKPLGVTQSFTEPLHLKPLLSDELSLASNDELSLASNISQKVKKTPLNTFKNFINSTGMFYMSKPKETTGEKTIPYEDLTLPSKENVKKGRPRNPPKTQDEIETEKLNRNNIQRARYLSKKTNRYFTTDSHLDDDLTLSSTKKNLNESLVEYRNSPKYESELDESVKHIAKTKPKADEGKITNKKTGKKSSNMTYIE